MLCVENNDHDFLRNYKRVSVDKDGLCLEMLEEMMKFPTVMDCKCVDNTRITLDEVIYKIDDIIAKLDNENSDPYRSQLQYTFKIV